MAKIAVPVHEPTSVSHRVAAIGKFARYKPEDGTIQREMEVKKDARLERLLGAWRRYRDITKDIRFEFFTEDAPAAHSFAYEMIQSGGYGQKQVAKFCIVVAHEIENKTVLPLEIFLSALINRSERKSFEIPLHLFAQGSGKYTGRLSVAILNMKKVVFHGDVDYIGKMMKGGLAVINGDAHAIIGEMMEGGSIELNGNVLVTDADRFSSIIGARMSGGRIIIRGDVKIDSASIESGGTPRIGGGMTVGEIHLDGDPPHSFDFSRLVHGRIFHRGKLIVDK